jgi:hypothetical protein
MPGQSEGDSPAVAPDAVSRATMALSSARLLSKCR